MRLKGKTAIITGSTKGIGRTIATIFAAEGANVVVTGRSAGDGNDVVQDITSRGGKAVFIRADMGDESEVRELVTQAAAEYGHLDILVNNAAAVEFIGTGGDGSATDLDNDALDLIMKVGLYGPLWACKYAVPLMAESGGGSIVNISSYSSLFGVNGVAAYSASKGALNALTRQMAVDYGRQNIRSNAIVIGFVASGVGSSILDADPVVSQAFKDMTLTRPGQPEDIAWAAVYLASDEAAFITGASLAADGGLTCRSAAPDFSKLLAQQAEKSSR